MYALVGHCRLPRKRMRGLCAFARRSEGSIVVVSVVVGKNDEREGEVESER